MYDSAQTGLPRSPISIKVLKKRPIVSIVTLQSVSDDSNSCDKHIERQTTGFERRQLQRWRSHDVRLRTACRGISRRSPLDTCANSYDHTYSECASWYCRETPTNLAGWHSSCARSVRKENEKCVDARSECQSASSKTDFRGT